MGCSIKQKHAHTRKRIQQSCRSLESYFGVSCCYPRRVCYRVLRWGTAPIRTNCSMSKQFVIERAVQPGSSIQRYPARVELLRMTAATQGIASHAYDRTRPFSEMRCKFIVCGLSTKCPYRPTGQLVKICLHHTPSAMSLPTNWPYDAFVPYVQRWYRAHDLLPLCCTVYQVYVWFHIHDPQRSIQSAFLAPT